MILLGEKNKMAYPNIEINGNKYYGQHLIIDCKKCKREKVQSIENWTNFIKELVVSIDMIPYGELHIARFGTGTDIGISAVQLIETSAITIHTHDISGDCYIDCFSCKTFSNKVVRDLVDKYFEPLSINELTLMRGKF